MTTRVPLVIDASTNRIVELPVTSDLNLTGSDISSVADITSTGNITAVNYIGNGSQLTGIESTTAETVTASAQPNITSVGTLVSLDVTGNISAGNVSATDITATTLGGTLTTGAQPNITGLGTLFSLSANIASLANVSLTKYQETVISGGGVSGTITPDASAGTIFNYTLTGNITINALANAVAGSSVTLILTQDSTGSRTLTSSMKFANGEKTLSTTPGSIDILGIFYNGTTYFASLTTDYD